MHRNSGNDHKTELRNAKIAQLVEHDLAKVGVAGSSPVFRSKSRSGDIKTAITANAKIAQLVEHDLAKVGVAGSSPVFRSNPRGPQGLVKKQNNV